MHYVNIALGTVFPGMTFCMSVRAALAGFVFTAKDPNIQKQKPTCAVAGRNKKHDRKTGQKGRPRGGFISKSIFFFQLKTLSVEKRKYVSLG